MRYLSLISYNVGIYCSCILFYVSTMGLIMEDHETAWMEYNTDTMDYRRIYHKTYPKGFQICIMRINIIENSFKFIGYRIRQNFRGFCVFQPIAKVFSLNHLLCTVHDGHGLMHRESFPVNSVFCAQPRKFSHSKVLPYTVWIPNQLYYRIIYLQEFYYKKCAVNWIVTIL